MISYGLGLSQEDFFFTYFLNCLQAMRCLNRVPVYLLPLIKKQSCYMSNVWHFFLFLFIIIKIDSGWHVRLGRLSDANWPSRAFSSCLYLRYLPSVCWKCWNLILFLLDWTIIFSEPKVSALVIYKLPFEW